GGGGVAFSGETGNLVSPGGRNRAVWRSDRCARLWVARPCFCSSASTVPGAATGSVATGVGAAAGAGDGVWVGTEAGAILRAAMVGIGRRVGWVAAGSLTAIPVSTTTSW